MNEVGGKLPKRKSELTRREFFKLSGAAGIGTLVTSMGGTAHADQNMQATGQLLVPQRPFGNTGEKVSVLGLGGSQDLMSKQMLLRQAFKMGITYWDTADNYENGNSERAIGKYLRKYPDDRKKMFLVTKSSASHPEQLTQDLGMSLKRLETSYIDLYFIHSVTSVPYDLSLDVKRWAERAKAKGKIRFFGFSTHSNMASCLMDAAKLGWIDGIMTSYNYRLMNTDEMKRAIDACHKAGIGLTAMKTQARFFSYYHRDIEKKEDASQELTDHFVSRGFTTEQAKLKVVWDNPVIASICSEMPNMAILQANVAASLSKTRLSRQDSRQLARYARESDFGYCAGCSVICESALKTDIPVSEIMRCLMYDIAYGKPALAKKYFKNIDPDVRRALLNTDFSNAEGRCPQNMPIGKLMQEASQRLT
jgi:aryl-alcohol dehydrogenase-like predicted oxidoreductase